MAIPPFPAEDLAKLVLGYLVEEQLMTAYDEFLHSSPYLDAHRNEYDRLFMYSLRKILAEYRAVRIYVEACRPISLRKKLLQCTNLLEIVKYLVCHIDVNQIQPNGSRERISFESQDVTTSKIGNESCSCLRVGGCICSHKKKNVSLSKSVNTKSIDAVESTISAQATSLSDLPGHQDPTEYKHMKVLECQNQTTLDGGQNHEVPAAAAQTVCNTNVEQSSIIANLHMQPNLNCIMPSSTDKINAQTSMECSQNIAEFNTVLNQVYNNSIVTGNLCDNNNMVCAENVNNSRISTAGTFQDFTTGVGGVPKTNINVPDSSTSESVNVRLPLQEKENNPLKRSVKTMQRKKCVFRVGNVQHDVTEVNSEIIDVDSVNIPPHLKPDDQKVTILSDVRVGNDDRMLRLAPVLKHATSTPLLQMQTILINGTPVYKPKPPEQKYTFTRDEIMAMPTIILVPSSGTSQTVANIQPQPIMSQSSSVTTSSCTLTSSIQPLTVDVSNSSKNMPIIHTQTGVQNTDCKPGLVKTVEALKNTSVPKDCIIASSSSTSTPHMLPPKRKSSSTPRRTSHVRVLDFTTPRRILNETINENPNLEGEPDNPEEMILSKSTNLEIEPVSTFYNPDPVIAIPTTDTSVIKTEDNESIQKKQVIRKKSNWDADLRALAVASESADNLVSTPKPKPRPKSVKKTEEKKEKEKTRTEIASVGKTKNKTVKSKMPQKTSKKKEKNTHTENNQPEHNVPSPDFSSIACTTSTSAKEKTVSAVEEPDNVQNKSNDEECIDTPEAERLSLQNVIGVKLNISDILATPYKQALYDIQMETPRFLGPDLPDDPMSDVKIMNIPTPRFLSTNMPYTPKPTQATPSSYSSRPTDYSSGGSYYKPDDQEYLPILEDVVCAVTSTQPKDNPKTTKDSSNSKEAQPKEKIKRNRSSRPVRQCTKNVSYYKSPMINKTDSNKKDDDSSCSDTVSANSSIDHTVSKSTATPRGDKIKKSLKSGIKKTQSLIKTRSPLKKVTQKSFMKIKPRRLTPVKKDTGKKTSRRASSKDKCAAVPSLVVPVHTKSRRKSSTPRKLHCTKTFNSESSGHDSPEVDTKENTEKKVTNPNGTCIQDSDTEQLPLRWSDDGSQDMKLQDSKTVSDKTDVDEISQIREYIDKTIPTTTSNQKNNEFNVQIDLIRRGFDVETAKILERDLLNTPSREETSPTLLENRNENRNIKVLERSVESDCSTLTNNLIIHEEGDDDEEIEFSVQECNEDTANYLVVQHEDTKELPECNISKLKDKFSMEICIDDGVVVRLRATEFSHLYEYDPLESSSLNVSNTETEMAVSSICNMERLYTPMKDPIRDQYYQIFDSTLTSIDTPLKVDSPKKKQDIPEIVLDVDEIDERDKLKEKSENRKRKRSHCSSALEESVSDSKKVKPETQFILNSKNIQNLDIESVLSKLHGP